MKNCLGLELYRKRLKEENIDNDKPLPEFVIKVESAEFGRFYVHAVDIIDMIMMFDEFEEIQPEKENRILN